MTNHQAGPAENRTMTRRVALAGAAGLAAAATLGSTASAQAATGSSSKAQPTVVLVHGAWADGSSWSKVIERLQRRGIAPIAVQLPLQGVASDAAVVTRNITDIGGPVLLVGHSYGGAVITAAGAGNDAVKGLVYVAAFAPDAGESVGALIGRFPPTPALSVIGADSVGELTLNRTAYPTVFAPDVPMHEARVMAATQGPLNAAAINEVQTGTPAWRQLPTWYQVSANDKVINPDLERFLAARMGADTITLPTSHASLVSRPDAIADLITLATNMT